MAGDWIKLETATSDKPEVWEIAEVPRRQGVAALDEILGEVVEQPLDKVGSIG